MINCLVQFYQTCFMRIFHSPLFYLRTRTVPSRNYHTPRTLTLPLGTDYLKWAVLTEYFVTWKVVEKHIKEPCDDV